MLVEWSMKIGKMRVFSKIVHNNKHERWQHSGNIVRLDYEVRCCCCSLTIDKFLTRPNSITMMLNFPLINPY